MQLPRWKAHSSLGPGYWNCSNFQEIHGFSDLKLHEFRVFCIDLWAKAAGFSSNCFIFLSRNRVGQIRVGQNRVGQNRCYITTEGVSCRFSYKALLEFLPNQFYTLLTCMQLWLCFWNRYWRWNYQGCVATIRSHNSNRLWDSVLWKYWLMIDIGYAKNYQFGLIIGCSIIT